MEDRSLIREAAESSRDYAVHKRLQKGARSCTECRRRKIRCVYPPGTYDICLRCSNRGSQCIDSRSTDVVMQDEDKKTLRERVSRLESLLEATLRDNPGNSNVTYLMNVREDILQDAGETLDHEGLGTICSADPPLVSIIRDELLFSRKSQHPNHPQKRSTARASTSTSSASQRALSSSHGNPARPRPRRMATASSQSQNRSHIVCNELRSALPNYQILMDTLMERAAWWGHWRQKAFGTSKAPETLPQYAQRVYNSGSPAELGILVAAYGRSTETNAAHFFSLVNDLVVSRNEYAASVEGMECLILLGKCFLDIGQPKRAWVTNRRGLSLAQLMNLHRNPSRCLEAECIWWSLYQGDRFMSLLLGLPYGIGDAHCYLEPKAFKEGSLTGAHIFVVRCGRVAGQVIDLTQAITGPSFSTCVRIDEELEAISESMPSSWWDIPQSLEGARFDVSELRQRLLTQVFFFHVRAYVYLPFMLREDSGSRREHSRKTCMHTAREMLRRYHLLRSAIPAEDLFECKTNDFVGFMAATILLISSISECSRNDSSQGMQRDLRLIETSISIFHRLSAEKACDLALQCHRALDFLLDMSQLRSSELTVSPRPEKIFIPYFGFVTFSVGTKASESRQPTFSFSPDSLNNASTIPQQTPVDVRQQPVQEEMASDFELVDTSGLPPGRGLTRHSGFYQADPQFDNLHWGGEFNPPAALTNDARGGEDSFSLFPSTSMMDLDIDIDQDWNLFLESAGDVLRWS